MKGQSRARVRPRALVDNLIDRTVDRNDDDRRKTIRLEPKEYDVAIVGMIEDEARCHLCYSVKKLIAVMRKVNGWALEEAVEWFEYNTVRALPYMASEGVAPVLLHDDI